MAEVVLGIGTSHGPMLVTTPDLWALRLPDDQINLHPWRGRKWTFDELVEARRREKLEEQIRPASMQARAERCHRAISGLGDVLAKARADVAIIIGNDQMEIYDEGLIPAFSILCGNEIVNAEYSPERMAKLPPGIKEAVPGYIPPGGAVYRAAGDLGQYLIESLIAADFDVASMKRLPKPETPHAYGFVYRHLMRDDPMPSVPVVLNTFYPPNQPNVRRCYAFGKALLRALQAWPSNLRIALIGSGGLTHFVIDEQIDQLFITALRDRSVDPIAALGEGVFQAGTSELKNWIVLAGAMAELGYPMTLVDYVPVYRSLAGTGNAMAFAYWRQ